MKAFRAPVVVFFLSALAVMAAGTTYAATGGDPAVRQIEKFYDVLLNVMKQGGQLGIEGRFKKHAPQIDIAFDLSAMTKFTVGPSWDTMPDVDRKALIGAFRRMTIANYAHNFSSYNGQKFVVEPKVEEHDVDHLVHSQLVPVDDKPVTLIYRMRQSGGSWKVIDVFLEGYVSELATRRSDFAATLQSGGAAGLIQKINDLSDKLMKGES